MTAKFGETGARGLLLKTLPLDVNLDVLLESKENTMFNNSAKDIINKNNIIQNSHSKSEEVSDDIKSIISSKLFVFKSKIF
jgi:hypothetical protein